MKIKIYHNPRCSKSREALAWLQKKGMDIEVIQYMNAPLSEAVLKSLLKKLSMKASELVRTKEKDYQALQLSSVSEAKLIQAMSQYPKLIERPIVVADKQAIVARPVDKLESFFA